VPHVYSIGIKALQVLLESKKPQSIIVSGESGAGKTETVRILLDQLADTCPCDRNRQIAKQVKATSKTGMCTDV
jgi:myosin heavy subunit